MLKIIAWAQIIVILIIGTTMKVTMKTTMKMRLRMTLSVVVLLCFLSSWNTCVDGKALHQHTQDGSAEGQGNHDNNRDSHHSDEHTMLKTTTPTTTHTTSLYSKIVHSISSSDSSDKTSKELVSLSSDTSRGGLRDRRRPHIRERRVTTDVTKSPTDDISSSIHFQYVTVQSKRTNVKAVEKGNIADEKEFLVQTIMNLLESIGTTTTNSAPTKASSQHRSPHHAHSNHHHPHTKHSHRQPNGDRDDKNDSLHGHGGVSAGANGGNSVKTSGQISGGAGGEVSGDVASSDNDNASGGKSDGLDLTVGMSDQSKHSNHHHNHHNDDDDSNSENTSDDDSDDLNSTGSMSGQNKHSGEHQSQHNDHGSSSSKEDIDEDHDDDDDDDDDDDKDEDASGGDSTERIYNVVIKYIYRSLHTGQVTITSTMLHGLTREELQRMIDRIKIEIQKRQLHSTTLRPRTSTDSQRHRTHYTARRHNSLQLDKMCCPI